MKKSKKIGNYVFPQVTLMQVAVHMVADMYRDKDEFAKLGISTARFDEITNLVSQLTALSKNKDLQESIGTALKSRNQLHTDLVQLLDEIALIIEANFGKKSEEYQRIYFKASNNKSSVAAVSEHALHIYNTLTADALFADFKLPSEYIENLSSLTEGLIEQAKVVALLITDKEVVNKQRTDLLNAIYAKLAVLSSVGKRIWINKEPAKYKNYVMQKAANSYKIRNAS